MDWFERLLGFPEKSPAQVHENLRLEGEDLVSLANGKRLRCGALETPSLAELRERSAAIRVGETGQLSVRELVADVQQLHQLGENDGALFQVASQFNLLEMVHPSVSPELGVTGYESDATQGPACAIACGAATVFRNYFAPVGDKIGQTGGEQIDCLADLGEAIGNANGELWAMRNGYALATEVGLETVHSLLESAPPTLRDKLRSRLRIGLQWRAGVTLGGSSNTVSQAFCSALPVAYSRLPASQWEPFARLVLEAAYEATLHAAVLNRESTGSPKVFLTLLGGGAFGNSPDWIVAAIERALKIMRGSPLEVILVSYGSPTPEIQHLLD